MGEMGLKQEEINRNGDDPIDGRKRDRSGGYHVEGREWKD
jgi:hypothetical protein